MLYFFWKRDCFPCEKTKPLIAFIEAEFNVEFARVNIEDDPALAEQYQVKSVPTVVVTRPDGTRFAGFAGGLITPTAILRALHLASSQT